MQCAVEFPGSELVTASEGLDLCISFISSNVVMDQFTRALQRMSPVGLQNIRMDQADTTRDPKASHGFYIRNRTQIRVPR